MSFYWLLLKSVSEDIIYKSEQCFLRYFFPVPPNSLSHSHHLTKSLLETKPMILSCLFLPVSHSCSGPRPCLSHLPIPHPSAISYDIFLIQSGSSLAHFLSESLCSWPSPHLATCWERKCGYSSHCCWVEICPVLKFQGRAQKLTLKAKLLPP